MSLIANIFLRGITGAFIANAGVGKLGLPAEASAGMQQFAATGIPAVKSLPADKFAAILGGAEVGLGALLLAPFVPNRLAGAGLTAFSAGLLSLYFANPENTREDGIRPSEAGTPLAKDAFLLAIGVALMTQRRSRTKA